MKCPACGSEQITEYHGHEACICGRVLDGDCCQGAQLDVSKERKCEDDTSRIDTNYEAIDY